MGAEISLGVEKSKLSRGMRFPAMCQFDMNSLKRACAALLSLEIPNAVQ